jgi:hypothetical protein
MIRAMDIDAVVKIKSNFDTLPCVLSNARHIWKRVIGQQFQLSTSEFRELKRLALGVETNFPPLRTLRDASILPAANPTEDDLKQAQALMAELVELHAQITALIAHVQSRPPQARKIEPADQFGNVDWLYRVTDMYVTKHGDKQVTPSDFVANVHNACIHGRLEKDDCQFFRDQLSNFGNTIAEQTLNFTQYLVDIKQFQTETFTSKLPKKLVEVIQLFVLPKRKPRPEI